MLTFGCGNTTDEQLVAEPDARKENETVFDDTLLSGNQSNHLGMIAVGDPHKIESDEKEPCKDSNLDGDFSLPDDVPIVENVSETKVDPVLSKEALLQKALERLDQKRKAMAEAEHAEADAKARSLADSRERCARELIANMVDIPGKTFKMGRTEVSQEQWVGIMGSNPSKFQYSDHPVESVSFDEVNAFIEIVNGLAPIRSSGFVFRLPSPQEWEYACRAGSAGDFGLLANGKEGSAREMAWYISTTGNGSFTKPVGTSIPNAWGLYDMHGNVKEWTVELSQWSDSTVCGGCYANYDYECTSTARTVHTPKGTKFPTIGFRLCADPK